MRALCGCEGEVLETRGGPYPIVSVLVDTPCGGHPGRIMAGVKERFPPEGVDVIPAVIL